VSSRERERDDNPNGFSHPKSIKLEFEEGLKKKMKSGVWEEDE
jgi:hypothetical protein